MKSGTRLILKRSNLLLAGALSFCAVSCSPPKTADDVNAVKQELAETKQQLGQAEGSLADATKQNGELKSRLAELEGTQKAAQQKAAAADKATKLRSLADSTPATTTAEAAVIIDKLRAETVSLRTDLQEARQVNEDYARRLGLAVFSPKSADAATDAENIPQFSWPPPQASATQVLPSQFVANLTDLADVDQKLSSALYYAGYGQRSYYSVPNGFAMVTRVEQFNADGTSKVDADRFFGEMAPPKVFSLQSYLTGLYVAPAGRYRVVAFVVTTTPLTQGSNEVTTADAKAWATGKADVLPAVIGSRRVTARLKCTALVYEFSQEAPMHAVKQISNGLSAETHLQKSRILAGLQ